jgi:AcrR family transcriptional regulator
MATMGPDRAGLKEVAAEAGVSHGLVTHYFGTFDQLVEAAFHAQADEFRDGLIEKIANHDSDARPVVQYVLDQLSDPEFGRFVGWAMLSGRFGKEDFFPRRQQGPKAVADAIEHMAKTRYGKAPDRDDLETLMVLIWCAGIGYSLARSDLWSWYGREHTKERDDRFRELLTKIVVDGLKL